jgi:hypothetical protein
VILNGRPAITHLDLAAEYGRYMAVERRIMVDAVDGGGITVRLEPVTGEPTISALWLRRRI